MIPVERIGRHLSIGSRAHVELSQGISPNWRMSRETAIPLAMADITDVLEVTPEGDVFQARLSIIAQHT